MADTPAEAGTPRTRDVTRSYGDDEFRVLWDATRCIHTAICLNRLPAVFDVNARPWVRMDGDEREAIADTVLACPTGALRYEGTAVSPEQQGDPTTIEVRPNGPLYVRGRMRVTRAGDRVISEEDRIALCRCGASNNKPFCDNSHRLVGFRG